MLHKNKIGGIPKKYFDGEFGKKFPKLKKCDFCYKEINDIFLLNLRNEKICTYCYDEFIININITLTEIFNNAYKNKNKGK